jgi:hypothetical protein
VDVQPVLGSAWCVGRPRNDRIGLGGAELRHQPIEQTQMMLCPVSLGPPRRRPVQPRGVVRHPDIVAHPSWTLITFDHEMARQSHVIRAPMLRRHWDLYPAEKAYPPPSTSSSGSTAKRS